MVRTKILGFSLILRYIKNGNNMKFIFIRISKCGYFLFGTRSLHSNLALGLHLLLELNVHWPVKHVQEQFLGTYNFYFVSFVF